MRTPAAGTSAKRVAVIGGGWAGLAAAVQATRLGHAVTVFEMAPNVGGRARAVDAAGGRLDNGQHILIGAYVETLRLMRDVGVDVAQSFVRTPLRITYPEGAGLHLGPGAAMPAFALAVWRHPGWALGDKIALLVAAAGWAMRGFECAPALTVATLTARLPAAIRIDLIDPLCVAALNTASQQASAAVFLRVLKDALFSGPGSADLMLPRVNLDELLPVAAARWLHAAGAVLRPATRVTDLRAREPGWTLNGSETYDAVVLAASAVEAARLTAIINPGWSQRAAALGHEPIVTVYLQSNGTTLPEPMLALRADAQSPAQFVFDRGQLGGPKGLLAFVISGAQAWVEQGSDACLQATLQQARNVLAKHLRGPLQTVQVLTEKRATFRCVPGLLRPDAFIAPGLVAAGDHVAGPYPATLEAAVRSGLQAAQRLANGAASGSPMNRPC